MKRNSGLRVQTGLARPRTTLLALVFASSTFFLGSTAVVEAQDDVFTPNLRPTLEVSRCVGSIRVDGDLSDAGWKGAAQAGNFSEITPGDQTRPPVETQAWITYDENNLYMAFRAFDDPDAVRSSLRDRDEIFGDDWIGIMLDTYGNAAWAYEIFLNPLGIQGDLRWTPNGEDISFDIVFESKGKVTADGYQVEVAIPFSSLRFPDRERQTWRATFLRTHPRDSRRQYSWATVDRDEPCFLCQFGTLTGFEGVRRATSFEILPALTGTQLGSLRDRSDPAAGFENGKVNADLAIGLRYSLTSSLTADATINPDFSQVEADAAQIDVNTTFALFFPERRPFFQEGSDLLDTWIDAVYTRSLNDPQGAVKLTGRMDRTSIAYIGARDEHTPMILPFEERSALLQTGRSTSNIFRASQRLFEDSFAGLLVTDRRFDNGGSGTVLGGDTAIRFLKNYRFEGQFLASRTGEPVDSSLTSGISQTHFDDGKYTTAFDGESYWGQATYASLERDGRVWNFDIDYWTASPTFRAANGFVTGNDYHRVTAWTGTIFQPDNKYFDQIFPNVNAGGIWNFRGTRKDEWLNPELSLRFKKQTGLSLSYLWSNELFRGTQFDGIRRHSANLWSDYSEFIKPGISWSEGRFIARNEDPPVLGRGRDFSAWATIKPIQRLILSPELNYTRLRHPITEDDFFRGYILRTRMSYQFTRELFLRLVVQVRRFDRPRQRALDIDPLLTYKLNPYTVFYMGSTHDLQALGSTSDLTQTERQFFAKFQYLLRV